MSDEKKTPPTLEQVIGHTGDSTLPGRSYKSNVLNLTLELFDEIPGTKAEYVQFEIKTDLCLLFGGFPSEYSSPCYASLDRLDEWLPVENGFYSTPKKDRELFRVRDQGLNIAIGIHQNRYAYCFRMLGNHRLTALVRDKADIKFALFDFPTSESRLSQVFQQMNGVL